MPPQCLLRPALQLTFTDVYGALCFGTGNACQVLPLPSNSRLGVFGALSARE
jgi:hypothetical protein